MGSNIAVSAAAVRMTLRWSQAPGPADLDLSALLLQAHGKVGVEEDFVFYNQPRHPSGAVAHLTKSQTGQDFDRIDVDLDRVPADVARVMITASVSGATLGQISGLELSMVDALTEQQLARFPMQGNAETAFLCGELYRRAGAWKFRAIGQGYSAGLAGIATDFGITVDDAPAPPPPPPSVPPQPSAPARPSPPGGGAPVPDPTMTPSAPMAGTPAGPPATEGAAQRTGDIASQVQEAFEPPPPDEKSQRRSAERDFGKEADAIGKILSASGEVPLVIASDTAFNTRVIVVTDQRAFQIKGGKIRRELAHSQVQVTKLRPLFDGILVIVESFMANQDFRPDDPRREEHILQVKVATPGIANLIRGHIDRLIGA
ncbi:MAG TPA: TerD family protein [Jatrophihabitans sp.]|uniref:TerD family protein n=1 Tax=Jatrophihabitans sp. TaxID=1932789 RepID=UPI002F000BD1